VTHQDWCDVCKSTSEECNLFDLANGTSPYVSGSSTIGRQHVSPRTSFSVFRLFRYPFFLLAFPLLRLIRSVRSFVLHLLSQPSPLCFIPLLPLTADHTVAAGFIGAAVSLALAAATFAALEAYRKKRRPTSRATVTGGYDGSVRRHLPLLKKFLESTDQKLTL
jgi:hypothetical protein